MRAEAFYKMLVVGKGVVEWIASKTGEFNCFGTDIGIGWRKNGQIVAGVAYANWNGVNVECHIASDGLKRWLTKQYLWTIFDYPFNQLGVNRITVCVGEGNTDSRRFVEHLGFIIEARLKGAHPTGDILIFCMKRQDCRFIQKGFHREKLAA
jgi:RimJ/RimL family protein N-acetyltransferase